MGRIAENPPGARPSYASAVGQELALEGDSPFGGSVARALKIPLQRWKLSLALLALCTAAAILYARNFSTFYYELVGQLTHRPPPEQKDSPAPKTLETFVEELKSPHYYKE